MNGVAQDMMAILQSKSKSRGPSPEDQEGEGPQKKENYISGVRPGMYEKSNNQSNQFTEDYGSDEDESDDNGQEQEQQESLNIDQESQNLQVLQDINDIDAINHDLGSTFIQQQKQTVIEELNIPKAQPVKKQLKVELPQTDSENLHQKLKLLEEQMLDESSQSQQNSNFNTETEGANEQEDTEQSAQKVDKVPTLGSNVDLDIQYEDSLQAQSGDKKSRSNQKSFFLQKDSEKKVKPQLLKQEDQTDSKTKFQQMLDQIQKKESPLRERKESPVNSNAPQTPPKKMHFSKVDEISQRLHSSKIRSPRGAAVYQNMKIAQSSQSKDFRYIGSSFSGSKNSQQLSNKKQRSPSPNTMYSNYFKNQRNNGDNRSPWQRNSSSSIQRQNTSVDGKINLSQVEEILGVKLNQNPTTIKAIIEQLQYLRQQEREVEKKQASLEELLETTKDSQSITSKSYQQLAAQKKHKQRNLQEQQIKVLDRKQNIGNFEALLQSLKGPDNQKQQQQEVSNLKKEKYKSQASIEAQNLIPHEASQIFVQCVKMKETLKQMQDKLDGLKGSENEEAKAILKDKEHLVQMLSESKQVIKKYVKINLFQNHQREQRVMQEKIQQKLKSLKKERQINHQNKLKFVQQCGLLKRAGKGLEAVGEQGNQFEKLDQLINTTPQLMQSLDSDALQESAPEVEIKIESQKTHETVEKTSKEKNQFEKQEVQEKMKKEPEEESKQKDQNSQIETKEVLKPPKNRSLIPYSKTLDEIRFNEFSTKISQRYDSHMGAAGYHIISEQSEEETIGNDAQTQKNDSKRQFTLDSIKDFQNKKDSEKQGTLNSIPKILTQQSHDKLVEKDDNKVSLQYLSKASSALLQKNRLEEIKEKPLTEDMLSPIPQKKKTKSKQTIDSAVLPNLNYQIQKSFQEEEQQETQNQAKISKEYQTLKPNLLKSEELANDEGRAEQRSVQNIVKESKGPTASPTMGDILIDDKQDRDQRKLRQLQVDLFGNVKPSSIPEAKAKQEKTKALDGAKKDQNKLDEMDIGDHDLDRNKTGSFQYQSIVKSNTLAGVTDDTIYGHQPSNNDPTDQQSQFQTNNSNFKSAAKLLQNTRQLNQQPETVKAEKKILEKLTQFFYQKEQISSGESILNQMVQSKDESGVVLENVNSFDLNFILTYISQIDESEENDNEEDKDKQKLELPTDLIQLLQIYSVSEQLQVSSLQNEIVIAIPQTPYFERFTSVRIYIAIFIKQSSGQLLDLFFEHMPADILVFMLTDPTLVNYIPDISKFKPLFAKHYRKFTIDRINQIDYSGSICRHQQILPKEFEAIYQDTQDNMQSSEQISELILDQIQQFRQIFVEMPQEFYFHQCFYYVTFKDLSGPKSGHFKLHQTYVQAEDQHKSNVEIPKLKYPLILLSTINATAFIGAFCGIFELSKKFSQIRIMNLRGCDGQMVSKQKLLRIFKSCDRIAHLNLSFMSQQIDEDILAFIGRRYSGTLISLELRACSKVDDLGISKMIQGLSGISRQTLPKGLDNDFQSQSKLEFLNLADIKNLRDKAIKSIQENMLNKLQDLSIWGCNQVTGDSLISLCSDKTMQLRRINFSQCKKISDDCRTQISNQLKGLQIYDKPDDFGTTIDCDKFHL